MDLRIFVGGFIICLQTLLSQTLAVPGYNCRMCKPGFYASRMCSSDYDTVCKPCARATFSPEPNVRTNCLQCSNCDPGHFVVEECSKSSDTKCAPCDSIRDGFGHHFRTECSNTGSAPAELRLNNISISDGVVLDPEDRSSKENIDLYESSSAPEDGSGETDFSTDSRIPINLPNVTRGEDEDEEEGSGEHVLPDIVDIVRNGTTLRPILLPGDTDEVTEENTATTPNVTMTTVRAGVIIPGGGIHLDKENEQVQTDNVDLSIPPSDLEDDNQPIIGASQKQTSDEDSGGASVGVVVTVGLVTAFVFFVLGFLASRVWNGRRERTFNVMEAERRNGKPPVECSGIEYKDPESGKPGSGRGVHGDPKINGNGTEPKPKPKPNANANPITASAARPIYTKPVPKPTQPPPTQQSSTAAQPPGSSPTPPAAASAPTPAEGSDNWAGFAISHSSSSGSLILNSKSERPKSEIKFIDEGSDDEQETDKLLPPSSPGSHSNGGASPPSTEGGATGNGDAATNADEDKVEPEASSEDTPMLPKHDTSSDS